MKNMLNVINSIFITLISSIKNYWNSALQTLIIMIILDYITGICKAIVNRRLNSTINLKGIIKKFGYFIIIILSIKIDQLLKTPNTIKTIVVYAFVSNEGISIIENWAQMGLPIPKKLVMILEQLKHKKYK
jgi:toxin secretion/phage lysis holin